MILSYPPPTTYTRPIVVVAVHSGGQDVVYPLLVDTGADHTFFPASYAQSIGHDNTNPAVRTAQDYGVGGSAKAYLHTLSLSLLDPSMVGAANSSAYLPRCVWTSSVRTFRFFESLKENFGVLGRDLVAEWKCVSILPKRGRWAVEIETR